VSALFTQICYGEIMKKILTVVLVSFLFCGSAHALTYVCEWEWGKEVYEIKDKKVYVDGDLLETYDNSFIKIILGNAEFKYSFINPFKKKVIIHHKVNLKKEKGINFYTHVGKEKSSPDIGKCYKI